MATFEVLEGPPGMGKSLYSARITTALLKRNKKWAALGHPRRQIWSNQKFSPKFEHEAAGFLNYWIHTHQLVNLRDCDIIWDEIATELDSRNWPDLGVELKRFLSQYRKRGIDIYANTQDFSMVDVRARLMISRVATLTKIIGSRDISATKPSPKRIWGLVMVRDVENYREVNPDKKVYEWLPSFFFIKKTLVEMYDTRQDIPIGEKPPLKHEVRRCEFYAHADPNKICSHCKIIHT